MIPSRYTVFLILIFGLMICCLWTNFLSMLGETAFPAFLQLLAYSAQISIFHEVLIANNDMSLILGGLVISLIVYNIVYVSPKSTNSRNLKIPRKDKPSIVNSLCRSLRLFLPVKCVIDCFPVVSWDNSNDRGSAEMLRLASFRDVDLPVSSILLALNGFCYFQAEDQIQCCWCSASMSLDNLRTGGRPPAHEARCRSLRQSTEEENYRHSLGTATVSDNMNSQLSQTTQTERSPDSPVSLQEMAPVMRVKEPPTSRSSDCIGDKVCCHCCTFVIENWFDPASSSIEAATPSLHQLHQEHYIHAQQQPGRQDRAPCPFVERSLADRPTGRALSG